MLGHGAITSDAEVMTCIYIEAGLANPLMHYKLMEHIIALKAQCVQGPWLQMFKVSMTRSSRASGESKTPQAQYNTKGSVVQRLRGSELHDVKMPTSSNGQKSKCSEI